MMNWAATREAPAPPRAHEDTTRGWSSLSSLASADFGKNLQISVELMLNDAEY